MKRLAVVGIVVALAAPTIAARPEGVLLSDLDGNFLSKVCQGTGANREICKAYIVGVADTLGVKGDVCRPEGVTQDQLAAIVTVRLKDRPAEWHYQAFFVVRDGLMLAFPCSKAARK